MAAFWPTLSVLHGYICGIGRGNTRGPSAGGARSSTYQTTAIGTENNTMDCSELTILKSVTEQTGMSPHGARNMIWRLHERSRLVERHHVGKFDHKRRF